MSELKTPEEVTDQIADLWDEDPEFSKKTAALIRADRLALLEEIERLGKPVPGSSNGSWRAAVDMLRAEIEAGE